VTNQRKTKEPFFTSIKESFYNNLITEERWKIVVDGLWETLIISILAILLGSIFGGFICWMRLSGNKLLKEIAYIYVEIIRGVPILVLLMLMFYVIFAQSAVSPRWVAIIAFAMNFGAYVSEMFRTGIEGVDRGQTEAGLAMGFSPLKTFIFFIIPQAAKKVIPVFKGEAVSLIKNTSVVGFIAIQDLTKASEIIRARTFDAFFPLLIISAIYFFLAWLLGKGLDLLAKKIA
jgi:amine acid ABC transporter, permease protein, 3-TM region, His/Glu/Gln/Arg/opine family